VEPTGKNIRVTSPKCDERGSAMGTVPVEVRTSFKDLWADGFEVVEETAAGYRLRRVSDGTVLPREFGWDDVREVAPESGDAGEENWITSTV
jgi:hypothetical protein